MIASTVDGQGVFHINGTNTIHGVMLQDAAGTTYTLSGASWFGSEGIDTDILVENDTADFVIHGSTGGVYTKVQAVERVSPKRHGEIVRHSVLARHPPTRNWRR